jgi:WD40 repeat protein
LHPSSYQTLLSGSTDGLVNIYDTTQTDEDDALIQVFNHGSSINHAGFLSDSQLYALSHDEDFSIYQLNRPDGSSVQDISANAMGDLREPLQCEYVVDCIPSFGGGQAVLGAGSHSKSRLDLVPIVSVGSEIWTYDLTNSVSLVGAHGEEIVRSMFFDHQASISSFALASIGAREKRITCLTTQPTRHKRSSQRAKTATLKLGEQGVSRAIAMQKCTKRMLRRRERRGRRRRQMMVGMGKVDLSRIEGAVLVCKHRIAHSPIPEHLPTSR